MDKKKAFSIISIISSELEETKDSELLKDITQRVCRVKMNSLMRFNLQKSLSVQEKKALEWKIVADVFACLDTSRLAKEHPKDCCRIVRTIATIVSLFFPPAAIIDFFPNPLILKVVEYSGMPTPEHVLCKTAEKKVDEDILKSIDADFVEMDSITVEEQIEKLKELLSQGAITEEEYILRSKELLSNE